MNSTRSKPPSPFYERQQPSVALGQSYQFYKQRRIAEHPIEQAEKKIQTVKLCDVTVTDHPVKFRVRQSYGSQNREAAAKVLDTLAFFRLPISDTTNPRFGKAARPGEKLPLSILPNWNWNGGRLAVRE
jgi:hypothetical protein